MYKVFTWGPYCIKGWVMLKKQAVKVVTPPYTQVLVQPEQFCFHVFRLFFFPVLPGLQGFSFLIRNGAWDSPVKAQSPNLWIIREFSQIEYF